MGNFQSICTRTADEGGGGSMAYPNVQNECRESILVSLSSIYKATKATLQKLCVMFNYLRPTKAADPPPSPNAPTQPLLHQIRSSSHSILESGLRGAMDDEEAGCKNVGIVTRCQIYSAHRNEVEQEHVVSVIEIECSNEIVVEIAPCLDEIVEMNSTREEETEAKEQVKTSIIVVEDEREAKEQVKSSSSSIVVVEEEKWIKHYSSRPA